MTTPLPGDVTNVVATVMPSSAAATMGMYAKGEINYISRGF